MAKLNEKKSDSKLERKLRSYLLEEHENFLPAVSKQKILAPTKVKMSEWKKWTTTGTTFLP